MKKKNSINRLAPAFASVLLVAVIFCGCEAPRQQPEQPIVKTEEQIVNEQAYINDLEIVVLDSCEYILFDRRRGYAGSGGICHKHNCKFCAERSKK
jgi:hypothetical protein